MDFGGPRTDAFGVLRGRQAVGIAASAHVAQLVEQLHGKEQVSSSNLLVGSRSSGNNYATQRLRAT